MLRTNSGRLAVRSAKRKSVKILKHQIMGLQKRMDFRHAHALLLRQPSAASTNTSSGNGMMEVKPCESAALLQSLWEGAGRQLSVCLRSSARFCLRTIFLLERQKYCTIVACASQSVHQAEGRRAGPHRLCAERARRLCPWSRRGPG